MDGWRWGSFGGISVAKGAETTLYVATSPEMEGVSGAYYSDSHPVPPSRLVWDTAARRRLWRLSEQLVGLESSSPARALRRDRPAAPRDAATG